MWFRSCTGLSKIAGRSELGLAFSRRCFSSSTEGKRFAALWGNGDYGRLGLGNLDSQWKPAVCSSFDNSLRAIACGGAHTLFLTESGRIYASGINNFGQLGISYDNSYIMEPVEVPGFNKEIKQIAAGYNHSCAITEDGELYVWGRNSSGQLGLGKKAPKVVPRPTKVDHLAGMKIKVVALGSEHSIAATGLTLSWGSGQSGRLGHGHQSSILGFLHSSSEFTPRLIKDLEGIKVKSVSASLLHSACIDENGCVYIFGEKALEKLGFGKPHNETTPVMLQEVPFCEDVACGGNGELYTWGSNENGCLGIGYTEVAHQPERVLGPFIRESVSKVSCGWKHTAAISGKNYLESEVFTWGWGGTNGTFAEDGHSSAGQLGHGTDVDYVEPARIDFGRDVKAVDLSCGFNHTERKMSTLYDYMPCGLYMELQNRDSKCI
ncbi:hypothetical protein V2J09_000693 [Rumex salicifolius]